jgi:hypothetical protein
MRALIGSGLCIFLGLTAARSHAQEIQFRSAVPTLGKPAPVAAPSAVTPVSYAPGPAYSQPSLPGVGLGRPVGAGEPPRTETDSPQFRPADRVLPFVRAQAPDLPTQPLPVGLPLAQEKNTPDLRSAPAQAIKPMPMPIDSEFVPPMPRVLPSGPVSGPLNRACERCAAGPSTLACGPILDNCCIPDCGCGCISDCRSCFSDCRGCFSEACCCDDCPCRCFRFYGSAAYLGWAFQRKNIPPLVTASPANVQGALGNPLTIVLFDRANQEDPFHSGGRFNFGIWMPGNLWALEVDYLFLSQQSAGAAFGGGFNGTPIFRPVFNTVTGREDGEAVAGQGTGSSGTVSISTYSQMWGLEMNARRKFLSGPFCWLDLLFGYRHLDLNEGIDIFENLVPAGGGNILIHDQFHTRNVYNGPQVGFQTECRFLERCFVGGTFKLSMGNMHEQVIINGSNMSPGVNSAVSGVFAQPTNVGNHQSDRFCVVPEVNFKLGYDINEHWRAWVGYDFLLASSVVRPGDQIDRRINPAQVLGLFNPNPPANVTTPAVLFRTTSFYAQGVSFGLQYVW